MCNLREEDLPSVEETADAIELLEKAGYAVDRLHNVASILAKYHPVCPGCALKIMNEALSSEKVRNVVYETIDDIMKQKLAEKCKSNG